MMLQRSSSPSMGRMKLIRSSASSRRRWRPLPGKDGGSSRGRICSDRRSCTKLVKQLGAYPLPVEVMTFNWKQVEKQLTKLFQQPQKLRLKKDGAPFVTDHGNHIIDISFDTIGHPDAINQALHNIPGVIETGLFLEHGPQGADRISRWTNCNGSKEQTEQQHCSV